MNNRNTHICNYTLQIFSSRTNVISKFALAQLNSRLQGQSHYPRFQWHTRSGSGICCFRHRYKASSHSIHRKSLALYADIYFTSHLLLFPFSSPLHHLTLTNRNFFIHFPSEQIERYVIRGSWLVCWHVLRALIQLWNTVCCFLNRWREESRYFY